MVPPITDCHSGRSSITSQAVISDTTGTKYSSGVARVTLSCDSKYDHEASTNAGLDFIFVSDWTEVPDWQEFCQNNSITVFGNLKAILR